MKLIARSLEIRSQLLLIDEKKNASWQQGKKSGGSSSMSQSQLMELISELELAVTKMIEFKDENNTYRGELRDHLIEVYQKVGVGLLKRQIAYDEKLAKQESEWRATCDRLIEDH